MFYKDKFWYQHRSVLQEQITVWTLSYWLLIYNIETKYCSLNMNKHNTFVGIFFMLSKSFEHIILNITSSTWALQVCTNANNSGVFRIRILYISSTIIITLTRIIYGALSRQNWFNKDMKSIFDLFKISENIFENMFENVNFSDGQIEQP